MRSSWQAGQTGGGSGSALSLPGWTSLRTAWTAGGHVLQRAQQRTRQSVQHTHMVLAPPQRWFDRTMPCLPAKRPPVGSRGIAGCLKRFETAGACSGRGRCQR